MKVTVNDHGTTAKATAAMANNGNLVREAMHGAAAVTAQETQAKCRADIAKAGNFGTNWTNRLTSNVKDTATGVDVVTTYDGELWRTFQTGRVVRGKPLLWIPLSFSDARGIRSSEYPGELVRVDRAGGKAPLLISTTDGQPKYFGKESVTIPKKFHLIEIAQAEGAEIGNRYEQSFARLHG